MLAHGDICFQPGEGPSGGFLNNWETLNFAKVCLQLCLQHLRHPRPRHHGCLVVSDLHNSSHAPLSGSRHGHSRLLSSWPSSLPPAWSLGGHQRISYKLVNGDRLNVNHTSYLLSYDSIVPSLPCVHLTLGWWVPGSTFSRLLGSCSRSCLVPTSTIWF